jgi:hypothetical protein
MDGGAARLGVLELFQHQHARAPGDHEAVAVLVIGARSLVRRLVVAARHRPHGVEQHRQRPVELLAAAGEHHVLLAPLDHFRGIADAVARRGAGRRDRIIDAADAEGHGERGRVGARHGGRHGERPDPLGPLLPRRVGRLHDGARRGPAGAHDDAGAIVLDVGLFQPRIAIACCMATQFHAAPSPMKRRTRRSTAASRSRVGAPCTWQRKPSRA